MPEAPSSAKDLPTVTRSTHHKNYSETMRSSAFEFFVSGVKHVLTAVHSAKSETIDIVLNKAAENFTG